MLAARSPVAVCNDKHRKRHAHDRRKPPRANICRSAGLHVVEQLQWVGPVSGGRADFTTPYCIFMCIYDSSMQAMGSQAVI